MKTLKLELYRERVETTCKHGTPDTASCKACAPPSAYGIIPAKPPAPIPAPLIPERTVIQLPCGGHISYPLHVNQFDPYSHAEIQRLNDINRKMQQEELAKVRLYESKRQLLEYERATRSQTVTYWINNNPSPWEMENMRMEALKYAMMYPPEPIQFTATQLDQLANMSVKIS